MRDDRLIIIGCGKAKLDHDAPARDLYTGSLFRARRRYAEESGRPWWIASALHGLIHPDVVLQPYDLRITDKDKVAQWGWGMDVAHCLRSAECVRRGCGNGDLPALQIELHMGAAYVAPIARACLPYKGYEARLPGPGNYMLIHSVEGLQVGEQLAWYAELATGQPDDYWQRIDEETIQRLKGIRSGPSSPPGTSPRHEQLSLLEGVYHAA